jgi:predicted acyltransferase
VVSLEGFRGAVIVGMILVNDPGARATYAELQHSVWNGWTFADTIAPAFLWIVGVSLVFSFTKRLKGGASRSQLFRHVLRRAAILFVLGLVYEGLPNIIDLARGGSGSLDTWRFVGTLQRIALSYLFASAIVLSFRTRAQAMWVVGLLVVHWALMMLVPVPGFGAGVLSPLGNLQRYVDHILVGSHAKSVDPLGMMGTLPSIATTLMGALTGRYLQLESSAGRRAARMFAAGIALVVIGLALGQVIPINKHLISPPFTILVTGLSLAAFALCYWVVDVRRIRGWTVPFVAVGMNAIFIFVLDGTVSELLLSKGITAADGHWTSIKGTLYERLFAPLGTPMATSFLFALVWLTGVWLIALFMYRKRWFVKV